MEELKVTGIYNLFGIIVSILGREELAVDHKETLLIFQWIFMLPEGGVLHLVKGLLCLYRKNKLRSNNNGQNGNVSLL